jgi:hypothetical protein
MEYGSTTVTFSMPCSPTPPDDALEFYYEVVEPTVAEFMTDPANKRRGCLACLALTSMTEHYFHARLASTALTKNKFKGELRKDNWTIGAIADVANATKHVLGDVQRAKWGYKDIDVNELNGTGIMRAGWPLGGREVLVGLDRAWRLSELLQVAMRFWQAKLGIAFGPEAGETGNG